MTTLTEERQELRDAIWMAGPEHFDVDVYCSVTQNGHTLYPQATLGITGYKEWTACFAGHHAITHGGKYDEFNIRRVLGLSGTGGSFISVYGWHKVSIDGWNPGTAYDALRAAGEDDRTAQWHVAVEWLDRVIKGGE